MTLRPDPSHALEATYREAHARMRGLPFLNPSLSVEAVGFDEWEGHWLGVMVTPWFINLVLAPGDLSRWQSIARGDKRRYRFPAGEYEFIGAEEPAVGDFQICSLFSPVLEFDDHPTARFVAGQARMALLDPANDERHAPAARREPLHEIERSLRKPMSRRDLLRARFITPGDDDRR
jgi:[NiFe] hydrogenase assembly HybE family chaperone